MDKKISPYKNSRERKKEQLIHMFDNISGNYDTLNRVISFGRDVRWRKRVVHILKKRRPQSILDIATGTGDLALKLVETGAQRIVGLDISPGMLEIGIRKVAERNLDDIVEMVLGDSESLPFSTSSFDAVTVAFGVRNFENLEKGLSEMYRVLKPSGTCVVLETSVPAKSPYRELYHLYTGYVLPAVGRVLSGDKAAYAYLSESAMAFPHGEAFNNILRKIGFIAMENRPQTFGVASIYVASKKL